MLALVLVFVLGAFPTAAAAHGPVAPVALDYLARVGSEPKGLDAKAVDGDQLMWLRVPARETVEVLDYRGAPYLRFSRAGVQVNLHSAMFYLNQKPYPETPPTSLGPKTPPDWYLVTAAHAYRWHDGRLHALATIALRSGTSFVGTWRVPVLVDGRLHAISGGVWHAPAPSIVWFWPIAVLLLCTLAAWRVRRPALDRFTARLLGLSALAAVTVGAIGFELHGRPNVSVGQLTTLSLTLALVLWALFRVLVQRDGFLTYLVIAMAALWQGLELVPTLVNGFVLVALPALVARAAAVVALGTAPALLLMVFRISDEPEESSPEPSEDVAWELA